MEFWGGILQICRPYVSHISIITSAIGVVLTLYRYFKRMKQTCATYLLKNFTGGEFSRIIMSRKEHTIILMGLTVVVSFLASFLYLSLIYSIQWPQFLLIEPNLTILAYALSLMLASLLAAIPFLLQSERFLRWVTGIKWDYTIKAEVYQCPQCKSFFKLCAHSIIMNPTQDLILGFRCLNCGYITKL